MGFNLSRVAEAKNPFTLPDPGLYYGYVEKAEIKTSSKGNEYINMRISLKDMAGNKKGSIFWMFFEADWFLYNASRFLKAAGFIMEGEIELQDIATLAEKKELLVVTTIEEGRDGYSDKAVPDFKTWHGFYPISEVDHWDAIINKHMNEDEAPALPEEETPDFMNMPEGADGETEF